MRLIEILLILFSLLWTLQSFSILKIESIERIYPIFAILLLLSHFGFEGIRWQMVLVYLVIVCLILNHFFNFQIDNKIAKWSLFLLGCIGIALSSGLTYLLPVFSIPQTTGNYNLLSNNNFTKNKLEYKIWLPTNQEVNSNKIDTYHSNPTEGLKGVMGMPGFVFSHLKLVLTNSSSSLEQIQNISKKPLVIYSHGANSTHIDNTSLLEEIASNGFNVVAINHDFDFDKYGISIQEAKKIEINAQKALIDKLIEKAVPNQVAHYVQIINDLKFKYPSQIDFTKIALIGHSLGGTTACNGGLEIDGVKAVVNMDGPIDRKVVSDYSLPFLYFSSFSPDLSDSELKALKVPPKFYRGVKNYELESVEELFQNNTKEKFWVRFSDANHLDFTDIPYMIPFMSASNYDEKRGHELKSKIIISFLNKEVNSKTEKMDFTDETLKWIIKTTDNNG